VSRRRFSEIEVIETLLIQGETIRCFRCKEPLTLEDVRTKNIQKEHLHEHALDGPDKPFNCRFSHKPCHSIITNGTPATTAGSSQHRLAKTRGTRAAKFAVRKKPLDQERDQKPHFGFSRKTARA
jgi:hypothetical protein